ncbi:hypothetical protein AB0E01_38125 [Nocardia vinacea]|uniref:hypothetical protein n=1 Tax=Nocardia vinacea TaxID=96468 RepID=UPI0033F19E15
MSPISTVPVYICHDRYPQRLPRSGWELQPRRQLIGGTHHPEQPLGLTPKVQWAIHLSPPNVVHPFPQLARRQDGWKSFTNRQADVAVGDGVVDGDGVDPGTGRLVSRIRAPFLDTPVRGSGELAALRRVMLVTWASAHTTSADREHAAPTQQEADQPQVLYAQVVVIAPRADPRGA